ALLEPRDRPARAAEHGFEVADPGAAAEKWVGIVGEARGDRLGVTQRDQLIELRAIEDRRGDQPGVIALGTGGAGLGRLERDRRDPGARGRAKQRADNLGLARARIGADEEQALGHRATSWASRSSMRSRANASI